MNNLAPITLFVYNRPWHTRQTLEALAKNKLADQSHLIIYCDGQKEGADNESLQKIKEVREVIREQQWCKTIEIIESETNKGLANSIIEGVTRVVNEYGKIIVLEDDLVTSEGFLQYMNDALTIYKDEEKVMHVNGYLYPFKKGFKNNKIIFHYLVGCWGWGTWKNSWKQFEKKSIEQIKQINSLGKKGWYKFTIKNSEPSYQQQLIDNQNNKINTWAVFWYASVFLKQGFTIFPSKSLVDNIGMDGSGEHCGQLSNNPYKHQSLVNDILVKKEKLSVSKKMSKKLTSFYSSKGKNSLSLRDKLYLMRKQYNLR